MLAQIQLLFIHPASFLSLFGDFCGQDGAGCDTGLPSTTASGTQLQDILQFVFAILAAVSVLFIVIAGFRMITAQGDAQEVGKARSTIAYAVVGLVVALLAEAFVAFVLDKLVS